MAKRVVSDRTIARERARIEAREKALKRAAGSKRKRVLVALSIVATAALGLGIALAVAVSQAGLRKDGPVTLPGDVTSKTAPYVIGNAKAPVTLELWEDFRCPACKAFEDALGAKVTEGVKAGKVLVKYHMVSFLTQTDRSASRRAANAAAAAYDLGGGDAFLAFHAWAYKNQPDEFTDGFFSKDLKALASQLGLKDGGAFTGAVDSMKFGGYVDAVNSSMRDAKISGTPTIIINGTVVDLRQTTPAQVLALLGLN